MNETWKAIDGYEGLYEVSDLGRIRNRYGNVRRPEKTKGGYPRVEIQKLGRRHVRFIHNVVAEAFIGPRPAGFHTAHLDGDKDNPALSNLRYVTPVENHSHKWAHGTVLVGPRNKRTKLTDDQVRAIRADYRPNPVVAKQYGITPCMVSQIFRRKARPILLSDRLEIAP